jgi:transcriptional regulator NrdR family protein
MTCPKCNSPNQYVIDSRDAPGNMIRRRRNCRACNHRWTTYEGEAIGELAEEVKPATHYEGEGEPYPEGSKK